MPIIISIETLARRKILRAIEALFNMRECSKVWLSEAASCPVAPKSQKIIIIR